MLDYYAARAREYDAVYAKSERQKDLRAIERWLPDMFTGRRVLEIACGTGYWTQFLMPTVEAVLAIDAAEEPLNIARERRLGPKITFRAGDAYNLESLAEPFDAALAGFWFSHVPCLRRREFLIGLNDALNPGALVVLLDNRFVEGSSSRISARDTEGNTYQERRIVSGEVFEVLKNFPSQVELRSLLTEPIATHCHYVEWEYYWALSYLTPR